MLTVKTAVTKALGCACALLLAFMTCLAVYQVLARYVLRDPSTVSEDLLSFSFVWMSLLATALVFGERDHMRLSFFVEKMNRDMQLCLSVFAELLILAVAVIVFLFGGMGFMKVGAMQMSPTLAVTMDWIYAVIPLSGLLIVLYSVVNIVVLVQNRLRTGEEAGQ